MARWSFQPGGRLHRFHCTHLVGIQFSAVQLVWQVLSELPSGFLAKFFFTLTTYLVRFLHEISAYLEYCYCKTSVPDFTRHKVWLTFTHGLQFTSLVISMLAYNDGVSQWFFGSSGICWHLGLQKRVQLFKKTISDVS